MGYQPVRSMQCQQVHANCNGECNELLHALSSAIDCRMACNKGATGWFLLCCRAALVVLRKLRSGDAPKTHHIRLVLWFVTACTHRCLYCSFAIRAMFVNITAMLRGTREFT